MTAHHVEDAVHRFVHVLRAGEHFVGSEGAQSVAVRGGVAGGGDDMGA
ncbi:hypothetical protein ACFSTC_58545 [Nonomuraea ferruginea]